MLRRRALGVDRDAAARHGVGTGPEPHPDVALVGVGDELAAVVAGAVGQARAVDPQGAGTVGGAHRDRVEEHGVVRRVQTDVLDRHAVLEDVAGRDAGVGGGQPALAHVGDRLRAQQGGVVQLGGEGDGAREVRLPTGVHGDGGAGGPVREDAVRAEHVGVEAELVGVARVAAGGLDPARGEGGVEDVVARVPGVAQGDAVQPQLVPERAEVALVADLAQLGAHRARGRGDEPVDRDVRGEVAGRVLDRAEAAVDGQVARRGGGVGHRHHQGPAGVPVGPEGGLHVRDRVGARAGLLHQGGDVGPALVRARAPVGRQRVEVRGGHRGAGRAGSGQQHLVARRGRGGGAAAPDQGGEQHAAARRHVDAGARGAEGGGVTVDVDVPRREGVVVQVVVRRRRRLRVARGGARGRVLARHQGVAADLDRPVGVHGELPRERRGDGGLGGLRAREDDDDGGEEGGGEGGGTAATQDAAGAHDRQGDAHGDGHRHAGRSG